MPTRQPSGIVPSPTRGAPQGQPMKKIAEIVPWPPLLLLLSAGAACDGGQAWMEATQRAGASAEESPARLDSRLASSAEAMDAAQQDRMLVQRGELDVETARPDDAARAFLVRVKEWGGHLSSQRGASLVVRVPAQHFDDAFAAASSLGRVLRESRQASDVTEEFVDLGIRIDTARKARERMLEVLQKAERIEDILKVEAELRRLTEEIERLEGRRKFLADQVALATLEVVFRAPDGPQPLLRRKPQESRFAWIGQVGVESLMERF